MSKHLACTISFLFFLFAVLTSAPASAAGVGIAPGRLEFDDGSGSLEATLYVINTGKTTAAYEIYPEEAYADWFEISPARFSLPPDENRAVQISLSASAATPGEHHTTIAVVAFDDLEGTTVGAGAKVPVHIVLASVAPKWDPPNPSVVTTPISPELSPIGASSAEAPEPGASPTRLSLWIALAVVAMAALGTTALVAARRRKSGRNP